MTPLLAWSQDDILAHRSGYHVLADYIDAPRVVTQRSDPSGGIARFITRVQRRFAFTRWFTGGSAKMEHEVRAQCRFGFTGPVHLLWCDRDLGTLHTFLRRRGQPLIGTFHQCADDLPQVIRQPSALREFAAIILMSETQRGYFVKHGVRPERLHRVLHGVDVDHFTPAALEAPAEFIVLSVGGTRRDFTQMRLVAEACADQSGMQFVFVGPEDKAHHFSGMQNVSYRTRVSDDALLARYRTAACFLHLPENATANNAMLEALACGAPVVSQRIGGVPEYLDESCARLSEPGDVSATVKALRDLAASRKQQSEMRHAARAQALTLDWRSIAAQTQQLYASLS